MIVYPLMGLINLSLIKYRLQSEIAMIILPRQNWLLQRLTLPNKTSQIHQLLPKATDEQLDKILQLLKP